LNVEAALGGAFDFREHAHFARGSHAFGGEPPVTLVFVPGPGVAGPSTAFGIGVELPPLD
jgi:hypothetical protein